MGAKRLEVECQILCAALRQSWSSQDLRGVLTAAGQLAEFFPDLLRAGSLKESDLPDLYEFLGVDKKVGPNKMKALFRLKRKKHLMTKKLHGRENRLAYYELLDCGLVLKHPRLRLSHDLNILRQTLVKHNPIPDDGSFNAPGQAMPHHAAPQSAQDLLNMPGLPPLVRLMVDKRFLGPSEVQALHFQLTNFKKLTLEEAILQAGYVDGVTLQALKAHLGMGAGI